MESKKYRGIMEAYSSIYEEKEESEMEAGEKGKKDEGGKHKEGKHPKGKEEKGEKVTEKEGKETEKEMKENVDLFDYILEHLVAEGYADTNQAALAIMANMSEEWKQSIVEELISEGEKPFPHEKVKAKQVALRSQGGNALERRMKMGAAVRRAKEAEKTGGSQQTAGAGWYHGR
jgi:predicted transcriptional regulator